MGRVVFPLPVLPMPELEYAELAETGETYRRYALGSYSEGTRDRDRDRISTEDVEPEVPTLDPPPPPEAEMACCELTKEAAKSLRGLLLLIPELAAVAALLPALPVFLPRLVVRYSGS